MRIDKQSAINLRKRGYSYNYISVKLNVPKSTLSAWFSKLPWSKSLSEKLTQKSFSEVYPQLQAMNKARSLKWEKWRNDARLEAKNTYKKLRNNKLFIAGVVVYWGEGDKIRGNPVRVSNVDPKMLRIFANFLKRVCGVSKEKITAHITLYPDLNENECKKYWSSGVEISKGNFRKTQIIEGRHKTKKLHHGICTITVSSGQLKEKILEWIKCVSEDAGMV